MKKLIRSALCLGICIMVATVAQGQGKVNTTSKTQILNEEEEEGPIMYQFEPDFLAIEAERADERNRIRGILDTLSISERKRRQLLKDFYKKGLTKRLQKATLVDTDFEDIDH